MSVTVRRFVLSDAATQVMRSQQNGVVRIVKPWIGHLPGYLDGPHLAIEDGPTPEQWLTVVDGHMPPQGLAVDDGHMPLQGLAVDDGRMPLQGLAVDDGHMPQGLAMDDGRIPLQGLAMDDGRIPVQGLTPTQWLAIEDGPTLEGWSVYGNDPDLEEY
eukprot:s169_g3.t1